MFVVLQASDNAKQAEDNARKAKSAVKMVLNTITALLDQLGKMGLGWCGGLRHQLADVGSCCVSPQETSTESI